MTKNTETTVATEATETTVAAPAVAEVVAATPKAPSKKSQALVIFQAKMAQRAAGVFDSNKAFRAAVLSTIEADLGVSTASAATMYNAAKKDAEAADAGVALGRDPKKVKVVSETGKPGRPKGSKNKAADADVTSDATAAVVEAAAAAGAEVITITVETSKPADVVGIPTTTEDKADEAVAA